MKMNKYDFQHCANNRGKYICANSYDEARKQLPDGNDDSWVLIQAWDSSGNKTWDIYRGLMKLPCNPLD